MWLLATYKPTTLFTLRPSNATSSGGRTLLVPTPYTIKMALLDAAIRTQSVATAENHWDWLRTLRIALLPPERAVVNNLFTRILKPTRKDAKQTTEADDTPDEKGAFTRTIGYREYVYYDGQIVLAIEVCGVQIKKLDSLLPHVTHLGKRGGMIQFIPPSQTKKQLPIEFTLLEEISGTYHIDSQLQMLDDCDSSTSFEQVNVFAEKKVDRKQFLAVVPYRLRRSSRSFSDYERFNVS